MVVIGAFDFKPALRFECLLGEQSPLLSHHGLEQRLFSVHMSLNETLWKLFWESFRRGVAPSESSLQLTHKPTTYGSTYLFTSSWNRKPMTGGLHSNFLLIG